MRYPLLMVLVAFVAALAGIMIGRALIMPEPPIENRFQQLIHDELDLDASQKARIAVLEKRFAAKREIYEDMMREDNRQLAEAIAAEKAYGPNVARAIDKSHAAMGMLQKQTMQYLFAMRAVLHPDQAARFDAAMVKALTAPEQ